MARILLDNSLTDHLVLIEDGVWHTSDEVGTIFVGGSAVVCGVTHVKFTLNFTGTSIALFGHLLGDEYPGNDTINEVLIDSWSSVNIFLPPSNTVDLWYESPTLPDTTVSHNITFYDFPTMLIDYALVSAGSETPLQGQTLLVDEKDEEVEYTGNWTRNTGVIKGNVTTSRAPVGGSISGTNDNNATATFRFAGTSVSVYGTSPSEKDVIVDFTLDGNTTQSDKYNATVLDPNFLWFSSNKLNPGNHTLTMRFSDSSTNSTPDTGEKFTIDYITYTPSFDTLSTKPDFSVNQQSSTPPRTGSSRTINKKVVIGAVVGPVGFTIVLIVVLCCWKRKREHRRRKKISLRQAIPYVLPSSTNRDPSTGSLLPTSSAQQSQLNSRSDTTSTSSNTDMLEVIRKPRLPGHEPRRIPDSRQEDPNPFSREIHKPRLPPSASSRSVTSSSTTGSNSELYSQTHYTTPIQEMHKPRLPGHGQVSRNEFSGAAGEEDTQVIREFHKPPLPGDVALHRRTSERHEEETEEDGGIREQHKPRLVRSTTQRRLPGRDEEEVVGGGEVLGEQHKPRLLVSARSGSSGNNGTHTGDMILQESRKPPIPDVAPHHHLEESSLLSSIRRSHSGGGESQPISSSQPQIEDQQEENRTPLLSAPTLQTERVTIVPIANDQTLPLQEYRKQRLSGQPTIPENPNDISILQPVRDSRSLHLNSSSSVSQRSSSRERIGIESSPPIVHSAQSPTDPDAYLPSPASPRTRTNQRWWRLLGGGGQHAHVEPFMLPKPPSSSSASPQDQRPLTREEPCDEREATPPTQRLVEDHGEGNLPHIEILPAPTIQLQRVTVVPTDDTQLVREYRKPRLTLIPESISAPSVQDPPAVIVSTTPSTGGTHRSENREHLGIGIGIDIPPTIHPSPSSPSSSNAYLQSPTSAQTRTSPRWWRLRMGGLQQNAHVEPFMLPSPNSNSSSVERASQNTNDTTSPLRASPATADHQQPHSALPITGGAGRTPPTARSNSRRASAPSVGSGNSGTRVGGVRQMIENAQRRLTMLENDRRERDVPPPPYAYQPEGEY